MFNIYDLSFKVIIFYVYLLCFCSSLFSVFVYLSEFYFFLKSSLGILLFREVLSGSFDRDFDSPGKRILLY